MATNMMTCPKCSAQNSTFDSTCRNCGASLPLGGGSMEQGQPQYPQSQNQQVPGADKKILAGILGIVLGGFGVHKFVLGYQNEGIILLAAQLIGWVIAFITCGIGSFIPVAVCIFGLVEGIIYLTKSDEEFVQTYIMNKKPWL